MPPSRFLWRGVVSILLRDSRRNTMTHSCSFCENVLLSSIGCIYGNDVRNKRSPSPKIAVTAPTPRRCMWICCSARPYSYYVLITCCKYSTFQHTMSSDEQPKETTTTNSGSSGSTAATWKLPDGIEDHLEAGLFKAAAGVAVGGSLGVLLFKSGNKGWRVASAAVGLGVAVGSTYARATTSTGTTPTQQPESSAATKPPPPIQTFQTTTKPSSSPKLPAVVSVPRSSSQQKNIHPEANNNNNK